MVKDRRPSTPIPACTSRSILTTSRDARRRPRSPSVWRQAVADVPGTGAVKVSLALFMNELEQRTELRKLLRGDSRQPVIPFAQPGG